MVTVIIFKGNSLVNFTLLRQEGVSSLWNGTKASLMLVSNPTIKFTVYEVLKRRYTNFTGRQVSGIRAFILGCIATAVATTLTYP